MIFIGTKFGVCLRPCGLSERRPWHRPRRRAWHRAQALAQDLAKAPDLGQCQEHKSAAAGWARASGATWPTASPVEESPRMSVGFLRISSLVEGPVVVFACGRSIAAEESKGSWLHQADAGGVNSAREQDSSAQGKIALALSTWKKRFRTGSRWKWEEKSKVKERHTEKDKARKQTTWNKSSKAHYGWHEDGVTRAMYIRKNDV